MRRVQGMLRITVLKEPSATRLVIEGKLTGPWIGELRRCWTTIKSSHPDQRIVVDLTEMTCVDDQGKAYLTELYGAGATVAGSGVMTKALIEEIIAGIH